MSALESPHLVGAPNPPPTPPNTPRPRTRTPPEPRNPPARGRHLAPLSQPGQRILRGRHEEVRAHPRPSLEHAERAERNGPGVPLERRAPVVFTPPPQPGQPPVHPVQTRAEVAVEPRGRRQEYHPQREQYLEPRSRAGQAHELQPPPPRPRDPRSVPPFPVPVVVARVAPVPPSRDGVGARENTRAGHPSLFDALFLSSSLPLPRGGSPRPSGRIGSSLRVLGLMFHLRHIC